MSVPKNAPMTGGNPADCFEWAVRCAACREWVPVEPHADFLDALDAHRCPRSSGAGSVAPGGVVGAGGEG